MNKPLKKLIDTLPNDIQLDFLYFLKNFIYHAVHYHILDVPKEIIHDLNKKQKNTVKRILNIARLTNQAEDLLVEINSFIYVKIIGENNSNQKVKTQAEEILKNLSLTRNTYLKNKELGFINKNASQTLATKVFRAGGIGIVSRGTWARRHVTGKFPARRKMIQQKGINRFKNIQEVTLLDGTKVTVIIDPMNPRSVSHSLKESDLTTMLNIYYNK